MNGTGGYCIKRGKMDTEEKYHLFLVIYRHRQAKLIEGWSGIVMTRDWEGQGGRRMKRSQIRTPRHRWRGS
jgi:hypothetical protein